MDGNEIETDDSPLMDDSPLKLSEMANANETSQLLKPSDDYEIEIDESTFKVLSAIANAKDDPQSLVELTGIDPNEFREFLSKCGETKNEDALELLRVAEQAYFSKKPVLAISEQAQLSKKHVLASQRRKAGKLYVGNLSFQTSSEELQELFAQAGTVESASVVEDRDTGRSRGFGFVEMATKEEGEAAIAQFNGKEFNGRNLSVNEARPREDRAGPHDRGRGGVGGKSSGRHGG